MISKKQLYLLKSIMIIHCILFELTCVLCRCRSYPRTSIQIEVNVLRQSHAQKIVEKSQVSSMSGKES